MITLLSDRTKIYGWILAALCLISLFLFLGETIFNTRGEPREAVVALSMLQDGNWILPINNGVDMAYKPPFFHWLIAGVSYVAGGVSEYTSRFPSALALALMVMAGYKFYARRSSAEVAFIAGLLTLTNFEVHRAGLACRVDMVLTLMMVLSLYMLYRWVEHGFRRLPVWAILALSGAFLSKGPVGAALPCLVVAVYALLRGKNFGKVFVNFLLVGLLSCILPALWYFAAWEQGGQRFFHLVYEENVLRLLGKMSYESHVNPWYYNLVTVISGFVPYTLLVLFSLFALNYHKPQISVSGFWKRLKKKIREMDHVRLFSLVCLVVIFVFYCIPKSKRSVYLLPIYPFIAYFLAEYILWLRLNHRRVLHAFGWVVASMCVLLPIVFVVLRLGMIPESLFGSSAQTLAMFHALRDTSLNWQGYILCALPLLAVLIYVQGWFVSRRGLYAMFGCVFALFLSLDGLYQPLVLNTKSDKPMAEQIARYVPQGEVYSFRADVVEGNPLHPFTINYYLGDRVVPFVHSMPATGYMIVTGDDISAFKERYPQYQVTEVIDFNHKSCDDRRMLHFYHFEKQ